MKVFEDDCFHTLWACSGCGGIGCNHGASDFFNQPACPNHRIELKMFGKSRCIKCDGNDFHQVRETAPLFCTACKDKPSAIFECLNCYNHSEDIVQVGCVSESCSNKAFSLYGNDVKCNRCKRGNQVIFYDKDKRKDRHPQKFDLAGSLIRGTARYVSLEILK